MWTNFKPLAFKRLKSEGSVYKLSAKESKPVHVRGMCELVWQADESVTKRMKRRPENRPTEHMGY